MWSVGCRLPAGNHNGSGADKYKQQSPGETWRPKAVSCFVNIRCLSALCHYQLPSASHSFIQQTELWSSTAGIVEWYYYPAHGCHKTTLTRVSCIPSLSVSVTTDTYPPSSTLHTPPLYPPLGLIYTLHYWCTQIGSNAASFGLLTATLTEIWVTGNHFWVFLKVVQ